MTVTNDQFRAALSRFPSGVTVVTTKDTDGTYYGITVSAFCSLSLEPPLVLICIEKSAGSHDPLVRSKAFVVNVLRSTQTAVSERFASLMPDKFDGVRHLPGASGIPVLEDSVAVLECSLNRLCDGGDHTIFIGLVEHVSINEGFPLVYSQSSYWTISEPPDDR